MLDCYVDYVGLQTCTNVYEASPSGLYLTQLPGVTIESVNNIADELQRTWRGVFNDIQVRSLPKFYSDLINQVNQCYAVNDDCDYEADIFCIPENMMRLARAWMYLLGVELMMERLYSPRLNRWTTIDRKQAEELRDVYLVDYENSLASGVKALDITNCDLCCGGGNPEIVYTLP